MNLISDNQGTLAYVDMNILGKIVLLKEEFQVLLCSKAVNVFSLF